MVVLISRRLHTVQVTRRQENALYQRIRKLADEQQRYEEAIELMHEFQRRFPKSGRKESIIKSQDNLAKAVKEFRKRVRDNAED